MKVKGLNGRTYTVRVAQHLIDWHPSREVSGPQALVKRFLFPYWKSHVVTEETPIRCWPGGRPLRVDLINWTRKIVVEVSPSSSHSYNRFFHKNRLKFCAAVKRDLDKEQWALINGFTFVELSEADLSELSPRWFLENYDIAL